MTENPALAAMEAYRRTHQHRSDELDAAMQAGPPEDSEPGITGDDAVVASSASGSEQLRVWTDEGAEGDAAFYEQLTRGRRGEVRIGFDLLIAGFRVKIGELEMRETYADRVAFLDEVDIEVEDKMLEVKSRALDFTGPEDYPFSTVFVGAVRRWEARERMPDAVVVISETGLGRIVIPTRTRPEWVIEERRDSHRGFDERSYGAPRPTWRTWDALVDWLRR